LPEPAASAAGIGPQNCTLLSVEFLSIFD